MDAAAVHQRDGAESAGAPWRRRLVSGQDQESQSQVYSLEQSEIAAVMLQTMLERDVILPQPEKAKARSEQTMKCELMQIGLQSAGVTTREKTAPDKVARCSVKSFIFLYISKRWARPGTAGHTSSSPTLPGSSASCSN